MDNNFSLQGKNILITGASSGIGRASAELFSKSGATLFLSGRNEARLAETVSMCSGKAVAIASDLSNEEGVSKLVSAIDTPLDGVFLCAGIDCVKLLKFSSDEDLQNIFNSNYFSAVRLIRELVKAKKIAKGASIVLTASVAGALASFGKFLYGGSKAALIELAKDLAVEFAPRKIRVNSIAPGLISTPMTESFINGEPDLVTVDKRKYLLGYGEPIDVACAAQYLLSDAARWVTGINLVVDGGYTCFK